MVDINMNQIYFWKRQSIWTYPWQREHLHHDFLKSELKMISETGKWYEHFIRTKPGQDLHEVRYYVTPIELETYWRSAIVSKGEYNYVGLSALRNCLQVQQLMLIPKDKKIPQDYSLIRITKSKKDYIHNEKTNEARYVINAESFEEEDLSYPYVDIKCEKGGILKFIRENISDYELIANSFQPTISSSPYVVNKKGGISLSTFLRKGSFSQEFIKTLKLMQPLEFTDLQFQLPKKLLDGRLESDNQGFKFHLAEKSALGNNFFTAFASHKYEDLASELIKRDVFKGEYSIACSLTPMGDSVSDFLKDLTFKFVKTEIMHPFNAEELKYMSDFNLDMAQKKIDEDLWLQVVNQRQKKPIIFKERSEILNLRKSLITEWEANLDSLGLRKNVDHEIKVLANASFNNILRVAQSIARDEHKIEVDELILNKSFRLFSQNVDNLVNDPEIQRHAKVVIPERHENKQFNAVRAELSVNTLSTKELYNNVKKYFKDIYGLQEFIDRKLLPSGYIFERRQGYYEWIIRR